MAPSQPFSGRRSGLHTERLGPLPLLNHLLGRLGIEALLERFVPTEDRRTRVSHAKALGVLPRSILVEREPVYRQQETARTFAPEAFGLAEADVEALGDDRIGRALDRLFDADRGTMLTELVVGLGRTFGVALDRFHDDAPVTRRPCRSPGSTPGRRGARSGGARRRS